MNTQHDNRVRRCPMLGHDIRFSYCRTTGQDVPCRRIYDCWWETFDIAGFMQANFDAETLARITAPPKPKATSLLEMIEQAKTRARQQE